jgi:uncharacterized repeat protein (TIGR03803 family)
VFRIDAAGTESVLYSFGERAYDGALPEGNLIIDSAGTLYGTTTSGGISGSGTIFKIDPAGTETILHSFGPSLTDALVPTPGLVMDGAGNLYGTTSQGGANVSGTVFKINPAAVATILYSFFPTPTDGRWPFPCRQC